MPSEQLSLRRTQKLDAENASLEYSRLLAFLELASGFNLALATCNQPALREQLIQDVRDDALQFGVNVVVARLEARSSEDFVAMVQKGLPSHAHEQRLAVMIVGVDELIYLPGDEKALTPKNRPTFVAALNFDRERIASELPYPLVLWAERETANVLLSKAPDLSQWTSTRFDFAGLELPFTQIVESEQRSMWQEADRTEADIAEFRGLLDQLAQLRQANDTVALRTRLAILNSLGSRYMGMSDFAHARETWKEALLIARKLGQRRAELGPLANLGGVLYATGEYREAIGYQEQALRIAREFGDRRGEETALGNLGLAYRALGDHQKAIAYLEESLNIAREIGDRRGAGNALGNIGLMYKSFGDGQKAIEYYEQALQIARELGDRRGELNAIGNLGNAYGELGDYQKAIEYTEQGLRIAREMGDRFREGSALGNLGVTYNRLGEFRRAIEFHQQYLNIARQVHDRRGEGYALGNLGNAYQALGEYDRAAKYHMENLAIAREIQDPRSEANALWNLSQAEYLLGQRVSATANAQAALKIFDQIKSPFTPKAKAILSAWQSGQDPRSTQMGQP